MSLRLWERLGFRLEDDEFPWCQLQRVGLRGVHECRAARRLLPEGFQRIRMNTGSRVGRGGCLASLPSRRKLLGERQEWTYQ
jgi:hypothetical protein